MTHKRESLTYKLSIRLKIDKSFQTCVILSFLKFSRGRKRIKDLETVLGLYKINEDPFGGRGDVVFCVVGAVNWSSTEGPFYIY